MIRSCVIMSVYNGDDVEAFSRCIDSLQLDDNEMLLYLAVDGEISEPLWGRIKGLQECKLVKIFWFSSNEGLTKRLNFLIQRALDLKTIEYIFRMDADDFCTPERFSVQTKFLDVRHDIDVVASHSLDIWENGNCTSRKLPEKHIDIVKALPFRNPIKHSSVCFRRSILERVKYNERFLKSQDRVLWTDIIANGGRFEILSDCLLVYNVTKDFMYRRKNVNSLKFYISAHLYSILKISPFSIPAYLYLLGAIVIKLAPISLSTKVYHYLEQ